MRRCSVLLLLLALFAVAVGIPTAAAKPQSRSGFLSGPNAGDPVRIASDYVRDNRRELYDRFLSQAQKLLIACENASGGRRGVDGVETAFNDFFEAYGVVQTVADRSVVDAARVYAYRLLELVEVLDSRSALGPESFDGVAQLVRLARHDTIDAMRGDLDLEGSARPPRRFNPFAGTVFERRWAEAHGLADGAQPG